MHNSETDRTFKKGEILVASWGYSMILVTFVRVIKDSGKTISVEELVSRAATKEEKAGRTHNDMQGYVMPTDQVRVGGPISQIPIKYRLYRRKDSTGRTVYKGKEAAHSSAKFFRLWDGCPEFEDHAD